MNSFRVSCLPWCVILSSLVGGNARVWTYLLDRSGPSPVPWPCRLFWPHSGSLGRAFGDAIHNPPVLPSTSFSMQGLLGIRKLSAPALPGSLRFALAWTPGQPLHTHPGQTCLCSNPSPQTNTHAGLTNPGFLPLQRLWPHPQESDVGKR